MRESIKGFIQVFTGVMRKKREYLVTEKNLSDGSVVLKPFPKCHRCGNYSESVSSPSIGLETIDLCGFCRDSFDNWINGK